MIDTGFKVDSSVIRGNYFDDDTKSFDFRDVPEKPFWFSDKTITKDVYPESGIMELPIHTEKFNLIDRTLLKILNTRPLNRAPNCKGFLQSTKSSFERLKPTCTVLDFTLLNYKELLFMLLLTRKEKFEDYDTIPIVMTGHSKCFNSSKNFEKFIKNALEEGYEFKTFGDWI